MNNKSLFAIYKYDFHKAKEPTIQAASDGVDGEKNLSIAQACFASLFDLNSVDNLVKFNKKGEPTRLPNDKWKGQQGHRQLRKEGIRIESFLQRPDRQSPGLLPDSH